jgi:hypothetical protein
LKNPKLKAIKKKQVIGAHPIVFFQQMLLFFRQKFGKWFLEFFSSVNLNKFSIISGKFCQYFYVTKMGAKNPCL